LTFDIKRVCGVLDFIFLLKKYEEKKVCNMLSLMLDPRFKNLHLMSSFIGLEQGKSIGETLYPMLLKCYHHLHSLFENAIVDQSVYEICNLDIFEMTTSTNELTKEFVS
jgi:hypothetical protein